MTRRRPAWPWTVAAVVVWAVLRRRSRKARYSPLDTVLDTVTISLWGGNGEHVTQTIPVTPGETLLVRWGPGGRAEFSRPHAPIPKPSSGKATR